MLQHNASDQNLWRAYFNYRPRKEYEPKCMVRVAKYSFQKRFICTNGIAVNQYVYLNECIKAGLVPYIEKSCDRFMFDPYLLMGSTVNPNQN